jgi:hypothetical protein
MLPVSNAGYKEGLKYLSLTLISGSIVYHCKIPCRKCGQCQVCEVVESNMETPLTVAMKQPGVLLSPMLVCCITLNPKFCSLSLMFGK